MMNWRSFPRSVSLLGLAGALALSPVFPVLGQGAPPLQEAQFDPSDVYFQGYLAARAAEQLEVAEDFIGALEKLQRATELFGAVRKFYPEWKPEMVGGRNDKTVESIAKVRPKAEAQLLKNRNQVAELEGGIRKSGELIDPARDVMPLTPGILEVDPLATRRLQEAEAEVERLRKEASGTDLTKQNDFLRAQLKAAEVNVQSLRARLAAAPLAREMQALNQRIEDLEQERAALSMALGQSRGANTEAMARIATLEADLKISQQKVADLSRDLSAERKVANSVVAGQRRQLEALEKELEKKNGELAKANEHIKQLNAELAESREGIAELETERDSLLQEKAQMANLLKLNEAGRIQDLIEQNMSLVKNLREANEKVDRLNRESNADKDATIDALRDLAIAKSQINGLHREKREQERRLSEMESRLRSEEAALGSGQVAADPAEVAVLRDIIQRQLRIQERRRQARDLLVEAAKSLGTKDERLAKAIELFDGQEIALTPEEQKLVAGNKVDGEFISPFARDRGSVARSTSELNQTIAVYERTAEKSFVQGRMLPTRELFQMILEQNPGHTPSLCKLGVVQLKLEEPAAAADSFRRAVELNPENPYAFRMLGYAMMRMGDLPAAEQSVRRAVTLAPNDVKSQMLLGALCFRLSRLDDAVSHFKAAISAEPTLSEPYYNIALIYARQGRMEDANEYYQQALERGAVPDPALEEKLIKP